MTQERTTHPDNINTTLVKHREGVFLSPGRLLNEGPPSVTLLQGCKDLVDIGLIQGLGDLDGVS